MFVTVRVVTYVLFLVTISGKNTNIPIELLEEIKDIVLDTLDVIVSGCETIDRHHIEYFYFNRQFPIKPILLNKTNIKQLPTKIPTKIILHGWSGSANGPYIIAMKDAYLKRGSYNIVVVNWERYATLNYAHAYCSLVELGDAIGDFVFDLHNVVHLELNAMHLIGHSLGAHLAGYVGQRVQNRTGRKISRITGLDAAGPGFIGFPKKNHLDVSDANFVDAIHTNGAQFGYPKNYGNVDFYPNCGLFQPGCLDYDITNKATILEQTVENLACSHNRSIRYFTESINSNNFIAAPFQSCYLLHKCSTRSKKKKIVMGEDCPITARGSYCLATNEKPPFAKGT